MNTIYPYLKDKVVVITGASSGLGEALVRKFIGNDCYVWMGARNEVKLKELAHELGEKAIPRRFDVTNYTHHEIRAQEIVDCHQRIDVWINNAGIDQKVSLGDITPDILENITSVNYHGLIYGTQAAARHMKKQGYGDIVQILSTSAFTPRADELPYCSTKAAAEMASKCAQQALKQYGIRVIPIFPGGMDTPFAEKAGLQRSQNAMNPHDVAEIVLATVAQPQNILLEPKIFRNG